MSTPKRSRYYTYIKPVITNPTVKSSAPYIFSVLAVIVFTLFVIRPTIATILQLQKNIEESKKTLQQLEKKGQDLTLAKQNLDNLDPQVKIKINSSLPNQVKVAQLISALQLAGGSESSASAIQIQPLTLYENQSSTQLAVGEVDFSFNIQGSYSQLLQTLNNLHRSSRLLSIKTVSVSKEPGEPGILSVSGKAYFLK